ncbi:MAG: O-antigen ligase family protein [Gaiellaceae bacterium]
MEGADLNDRLFNLSGTGRVEQWRVAFDDVSEHPAFGSGAGSYQRFWLEHRESNIAVRDAHSLYLEILAELGPVGLALVLLLIGFPLVLAVRLRRRPLVPIAAAALVAYLARAGIDWDWEFPILTLVALACAGVIVAEGVERPTQLARWVRVALLAAVVALVPVVAVTTFGNRAEAASAEAFGARDFDRAAAEAETAERLAPWSVEPLVLLGRAQAAAGDHLSARVTFRRAAARAPERWRVWFELAAVSKGPRREAALRRARALNPLESQIRDLEEGP